ncbi:MAG TPA: hydrogenase maturation nickel metallochaperone HypA [Anaeromyxobacteraceae bacterium]|jgi:hydrogenase nickel incorporation protein HypA/HybF
MHEYSLVEALVRRVEAEADARQAVAVHGLVVSIGELAGVDPELFRTAWETFRQGTRCERTAIEIRRAPATWSCPRCGREIERGAPLRCGPCGEPARLSERADALLLESIDLEVP